MDGIVKRIRKISEPSSEGEGPKKRWQPRVAHAVVHESHFLDPMNENHIYHEHVEVSAQELFFDLIFVAAGIQLSGYLKQSLVLSRFLVTFALFATAWLTWFHMNMLNTRFQLPAAWSMVTFFIMLGTLGIASHAVKPDEQGSDSVSSGVSEQHLGLFLSIFLTRFSFLCIYILVWIQIPLSRPMLKYYIGCFALSGFFTLIIATADESSTTTFALWVTSLVIEMAMYPLGMFAPKRFRMSVNMEHALERNQLWVILILGESIISLETVHPGSFGASYYFSEIFGFVLVYCIMQYHVKSQLEYDVTADEHALETSQMWAVTFDLSQLLISAGMLGFAVGLKLAVLHSEDGKFKTSYRLMLTGSLAFTLIWMNISRACHRFVPYELLGSMYGRYYIWSFHVILAVIMIPLGFADLNAPLTVGILAGMMLCLIGTESFLKSMDEPVDTSLAHVLDASTQTQGTWTPLETDLLEVHVSHL